jgi:hypothetical protein
VRVVAQALGARDAAVEHQAGAPVLALPGGTGTAFS